LLRGDAQEATLILIKSSTAKQPDLAYGLRN
jgi:hypothetical protein